jgi:hypothetical protein
MQRLRGLARGVLALLGAIILVGVGLQGVNWLSVLVLKGRLEAQYTIVRQLHKGMLHEDVLRLIAEHSSPHLSERAFPDGGITIWTQYSLMDACYTTLQFNRGALVSTRTSGEDAPTDYCPGAPADIR